MNDYEVAQQKMGEIDGRIQTPRNGTDLDDLERRSIAARAAGQSISLSPDELDGILYWLWSGLRARSRPALPTQPT